MVHGRFYRYLFDFNVCLCSVLCALPLWGTILQFSSRFVGFTFMFPVLCGMSVPKDTALATPGACEE